MGGRNDDFKLPVSEESGSCVVSINLVEGVSKETGTWGDVLGKAAGLVFGCKGIVVSEQFFMGAQTRVGEGGGVRLMVGGKGMGGGSEVGVS